MAIRYEKVTERHMDHPHPALIVGDEVAFYPDGETPAIRGTVLSLGENARRIPVATVDLGHRQAVTAIADLYFVVRT